MVERPAYRRALVGSRFDASERMSGLISSPRKNILRQFPTRHIGSLNFWLTSLRHNDVSFAAAALAGHGITNPSYRVFGPQFPSLRR